MTAPRVVLGDLLRGADPGFASGKRSPDGVLQVRMNCVDSNGALELHVAPRVPPIPNLSRYLLQPNDVLFNATNSPDLVGKTALFAGSNEPVTFSNHFLRLRVQIDRLDPAYLVRWLGYQWKRRRFQAMCTQWVNQASIRRERLLGLEIPLPPLAEQRRIAAVLDKVDGVRRKRREAIGLLDEFLRSAFLEMFGDPVRNEKGWEVVRFGELLLEPLRNGLSPARGGMVDGRVLTLSAITGLTFDPSAVKQAHFSHEPSDNQRVHSDDFLICRGNGNLALMGRGRFPQGVSGDTLFPDTMIAARLNMMKVEPRYLEAIWATRAVRRSLERAARTTSGIYKINQQLLTATSFPLPPMVEQKRFAKVADTVVALRRRLSATDPDALFALVAQRAFQCD